MEYILCERYKDDWCLFRAIGKQTEEHANEILEKARELNKDKELILKTIEDKDCWWNQPD